jgi:hypothetical protein
MRTVSFLGCTLPVSFFGGMAPVGAFGILGIFGAFSAIYQLLLKLNFTSKTVNQHFPGYSRPASRTRMYLRNANKPIGAMEATIATTNHMVEECRGPVGGQ